MNTNKQTLTGKTVIDYKNNSITIHLEEKIILLYNGLTGVPKRLHCIEAIVKGFTKEKIKIYVPITGENMSIRCNQFRFKFDYEK